MDIETDAKRSIIYWMNVSDIVNRQLGAKI